MKVHLTIEVSADIEQTEDATTRQNENISAAVSWLEGNGRNNSRLIDRIQQIGSKKSSNKKVRNGLNCYLIGLNTIRYMKNC